MKKKILSIILVLTIVLSSSISSFANDYDDLIIQNDKTSKSVLTVGSYVLTKEAFNIIVGVASACGVALLTDTDKFDFVDNFINAWIYDKVDSGQFSTTSTKQEIVDDMQNTFSNNSSKPPSDDKNIIVNSTLVAGIISIFNKLFDKENEPIYHFDKIPVYPNYLNLKEEYGHNVQISFRTSDGQQMKSKYYKGNYHLIYLSSTYNDLHNGANSSFTNSDSLSYVPCGSSYCGTNHKYYDVPGYYHLGVGLSSSDGFKYKAVYNSSSSSPMQGAPFTFYIPIKKFMSNYKPISNINKVSNDNVVSSTNPNYVVDGSLDIPTDKLPTNELPSYPSLEDIDFSGFDFSSLGSLFENFKNKFPFSLPFDLHNILSSFSVEPEAPIFEVPLFSESITIDLTQFNELANIIRMFVLIGWVVGLFILTKTFGG